MQIRKKGIAISMIASAFLVNLLAKEPVKLNEVIVTAQKSEEKVLDVPISITLFDELAIEDQKVESLKDIARYTPNFLASNPGDFGVINPSIRGLNTDPSSAATSVSMYIDGVPTFTTLGYDAILEDIERIEILKGPQGTLYGKNAYAGVLNILTKKPDNEKRGKIKVELGSKKKRLLAFNVSGPIIEDELFLGLSARHYEKEGFMKNTYLNTRENDRENNFGKIYLRYTPSDNLELSLISSKVQRDDGSVSQNLSIAKDPKKISSDINGYIKSHTLSHALNLVYNWDKYKFSSTTTYQKNRDYRLADFDYKPIVEYHSYVDASYVNKTQEFKLNVNEGKFNYLLGLVADKFDKDGGYRIDSAFYPPSYKGQFDTILDDKSYGVFAHADYKINDSFSILGGLRYDKDEKSIKDLRNNVSLDSSYSEISPKLAFKYQLNDKTMTYLNIAKGYKSGGFYQFAPSGKQAYDKETLWNYELGFKSSMLNDKLNLNAALFYMDISDMQVLTAINANQGYLSNAASATSKGAELEINYALSNNLSFFSSLGINQTKFDKFSDSKGNYGGNYNPYAPKYNYNLGFQYRDERGLFLRTDINGYGKTYLDKANKFEKKAYSLVNTKIGYESDSFEVYLYGNNIFDKNHDTVGYYEGQYTMLYPQREIGIQLNYRF